MKSISLVISLHFMTQSFTRVNQSQNSYLFINSLPPLPRIDDTSRKFHSHEIIYAGKFSLSSTSATKIYIDFEIFKWNNSQVHISISQVTSAYFYLTSHKFPFTNCIYYLTNCHLHNIFFLKKFNDRNGQKHDPRQEIPKIYAKQFS